jgi:hypothetical protein
VLPLAVAGQLLEAVAWGNAQVVEQLGGIKHSQLSQGCPLQRASEPLHSLSPKEPFRFPVAETSDHCRL